MTPLNVAGKAQEQGRTGARFAELAQFLDKPWIRCVAILLLGFAARFPALQGQFLWDDGYLAQANPFIKSPLLIFETFRHNMLLESLSAHYRPVQTVSYMLDYVLWNTNPYGFHLSNVLWHVGSAILLYFLLTELFCAVGERWLRRSEDEPKSQQRGLGRLAFLVALLWLVHPVHSAAVDYVSGRADSLAFFFSCAAWLCYLRGRTITRASLRYACYTCAAAAGFLALCSRESAAMWALLFIVYLFTLEKKLSVRRKLLVLTACLAVVTTYAVIRHQATSGGARPAFSGSPAPIRATLMLRGLGDYGRLMIFPSSLHMERSLTDTCPIATNQLWRRAIADEYLSVLGLLTAGGLLFGATRKGKAQNLRAAGAGWFILTYLPISNLLDLNATVAEHWLYLPSVGFLLFVVGCALELPQRGRKFALVAAYCAVVALTARSFVRSTDWVDPETFYHRTFAAGGASVRVALNLGQIYASHGDYVKAEELCRKVLQLVPDYPIARNNLAVYLSRQGKQQEADEVLAAANKAAEQAKTDYPRTWIAALNMAHLRIGEHDTAGAIEILEKARAQYPGVWDLISAEAEALAETQQPEAALKLVQQFATQNRWHYAASLFEGTLRARLNETSEAEAALWHASWLDVHEVEALDRLAEMAVKAGRLDDARGLQQRAISRQPDQPRQYVLLAEILQKMGRTEQARETLTIAQSLVARGRSWVES